MTKPKIFKNTFRHLFSLLFILFMIFLAVGSDDSGSSSSTSSSVSIGEHKISGSGYIGSRSKETHKKLIDYAVQKDMEAFNKLYAAGMLTGECVKLIPGETVYVVDTSIFQGLVKIRRKGDTIEYWTQIEAVK